AQFGSAAHRVDQHRRVAIERSGVFVFDDATGRGDDGGDAVVLVVAVGDVCTFGGDGADFAATVVIGVNGDLPVAIGRRDDIAVAVIGHRLALAVGIDNAHDPALPVGDPGIRAGSVVGRHGRDPAAQVGKAYASAIGGQLADHAVLVVVEVFTLDDAVGRGDFIDQSGGIPPVGAGSDRIGHTDQAALIVVEVFHASTVRRVDA